MGNTFGHLFRITTYGESHGGGVGVIIDGCPPLIEITEAEIQVELDRRRPGQSKITTPRKETDTCEILSGVFEGKTTGTPISILVRNQDARSQDYSEMVQTYRPSHADATYDAKYGIRNWQGDSIGIDSRFDVLNSFHIADYFDIVKNLEYFLGDCASSYSANGFPR